MSLFLSPIIALALSAAPGPRSAPVCTPEGVAQATEALAGNRLVQTGRMIDRLRPACGMENDFRRLEAAWMLAAHRDAEALTRYEGLILRQPGDPVLLAGAGRAALRLGSLDRAAALLDEAVAQGSQDWRVWNALGTVRDKQSHWIAAEEAYARAVELAPDQASIWNNQGYSLLLQRRGAEAAPLFERAISLNPNLLSARNNLELARALTGQYDEQRKPDESARDWSRRLNNQGFGALAAGDRESARRLFSQAITASPSRFEAAERNLARASAE